MAAALVVDLEPCLLKRLRHLLRGKGREPAHAAAGTVTGMINLVG
jgi:hypothetical protein